MNFFTLMVAAGNDTTRYTMAGTMKAMIEHPDAVRAAARSARHPRGLAHGD